MAGGASAHVSPDGTRGTGGLMGGWTGQLPSPPGEGFRSPSLTAKIKFFSAISPERKLIETN